MTKKSLEKSKMESVIGIIRNQQDGTIKVVTPEIFLHEQEAS